MSVIVAEGQLAATLSQAAGPIEVRTLDGRLLGMFSPKKPNEPDIDFEQLAREIDNPDTKWHTAEEVMARLRELRCTP